MQNVCLPYRFCCDTICLVSFFAGIYVFYEQNMWYIEMSDIERMPQGMTSYLRV